MGFEGVIISDDMIMKGVAGFGVVEACEAGIRAGLNMFIFRNSNPEIIDTIEILAKKAQTDVELFNKIEDSYSKIIALKEKFGIL